MRQQRKIHEIRHDIEHGNGNIDSCPSAAALNQRTQNRRKRRLARSDVTDGNTHPCRLLLRTINRTDPTFSLYQKIVGFLPGTRTRRTISIDLTGDEASVVFTQRLATKTTAGKRPRREVVQKHISLFKHRPQQRFISVLVEINTDRLLASVKPGEKNTFSIGSLIVSAGKISFCALHLNHPRPGIGQHQTAIRGSNRLLH